MSVRHFISAESYGSLVLWTKCCDMTMVEGRPDLLLQYFEGPSSKPRYDTLARADSANYVVCVVKEQLPSFAGGEGKAAMERR